MTGSTLTAPPNQGSWTVVHDGGIDDPRWNTITWTAEEPGDSLIKVFVEGSDDEDCAAATFSGKQEVTNGESIASFSGKRCLKLTVEFTRSSTAQDGGEINDSPILYDIAVNSNTPPVAQCKDIQVSLDANGNATISPADVDNGSYDPDGDPVSLSISKSTFTCADVGVQNFITLTATDNRGESDSCAAEVTTVDDLPPVVKTKDISILLDETTKTAVIDADAVDDGSTDNCCIASRSISKSEFTYADLTNRFRPPQTVTLTVTDCNGNSSSAIAAVTVEIERLRQREEATSREDVTRSRR
jgi:hypothetical protein